EILALYLAAGRGLSAAHAAGLVHRDFKPDNVLIGSDGRPRVADFGLARELPVAAPTAPATIAQPDGTPTRTLTGRVIGTPAYMAPERRRGARTDARADQYAFAVTLWEALTGAHPFAAASEAELAAHASLGQITPPATGRLTRHIERALRRALAPAP